jgi:hypothetical protein
MKSWVCESGVCSFSTRLYMIDEFKEGFNPCILIKLKGSDLFLEYRFIQLCILNKLIQ